MKQLKPITDKNGVRTHRWVGSNAGVTFRETPTPKKPEEFDPIAYVSNHNEILYNYATAVLNWSKLVKQDPEAEETQASYDVMNKLGARITKADLKTDAQRYLNDLAAEHRVVDTANRIGANPNHLNIQIMEALNAHVETSDISISVPNEAVLWHILNDGAVKTVAEEMLANNERVPLYTERRYQYEEEWFGIDKEQKSGRPVYAAVTNPNSSPELVESSNYGDIQIVLKPEVKQRATFTIGDSFNNGHRHIRPFTLDEENPFVGVSEDNAFALSKIANPGHNLGSIEYVEAQIHGGVTLDDIAEIRVPEWKELSQEVANFIADKKIKLVGGDIF